MPDPLWGTIAAALNLIPTDFGGGCPLPKANVMEHANLPLAGEIAAFIRETDWDALQLKRRPSLRVPASAAGDDAVFRLGPDGPGHESLREVLRSYAFDERNRVA